MAETEVIRIKSSVMNRLRKNLALQTDGRIYGKISATVEKAIVEYLDRQEKVEKAKDTT